MRRWRTTFSEPAVEPAEPPANISATSAMTASGATAVHSLKSTLENPVVVMIETVWKIEFRTASSPR
jgi:hypothetical protein